MKKNLEFKIYGLYFYRKFTIENSIVEETPNKISNLEGFGRWLTRFFGLGVGLCIAPGN